MNVSGFFVEQIAISSQQLAQLKQKHAVLAKLKF